MVTTDAKEYLEYIKKEYPMTYMLSEFYYKLNYNEALDDITKQISGASIYYRFSKEELIKIIEILRK